MHRDPKCASNLFPASCIIHVKLTQGNSFSIAVKMFSLAYSFT